MGDFTHFNDQGRAKMVDVGEKPPTRRSATAAGRVLVNEGTFRLIESGDREANELFDWFKELTLEYVKGIYEKLNVTFDSYAGERFYTDKMGPVVDELREKGC